MYYVPQEKPLCHVELKSAEVCQEKPWLFFSIWSQKFTRFGSLSFPSQKSSSSESLSDKASSELKKSFDAVVFDVLKVTPEEYAVSPA